MASIKTDSRAARIVLTVCAVIAFGAALFPAKWGVANSIALRAEYPEVSDIAVWLAPDDPQTNYTSAFLREHSLDSPEFETSLAEYELAASFAPNNYLYWLELGNARARFGEAESAEKALRRALQLAPNYSAVQWALGNTILRRGNPEEAFELFLKAASANPKYGNSAAVTIWQYLDRDLTQTIAVLERDPALLDSLIGILAADKRLDEALFVWERLDGQGHSSASPENEKALYAAMIEAKRFRDAVKILGKLDTDGQKYAADSVTNGDFESPVKTQNASVFDWRIAEGSMPRIALTDAQKYSGHLSLLISFGGGEGELFRSISQTIAVTPGGKYIFQFHSRSELKTLAEIKWEIVDAVGRAIVTQVPIAVETPDWTSSQIEFTVPDESDGIEIRLVRGRCATSGCFAAGNLWLDDVKIGRR